MSKRKLGNPRDSQRSKVYAAESEWLASYPRAARKLSKEQAQEFIHNLALRHRTSIPEIRINGHLKATLAQYHPTTQIISVAQGGTEALVVLHEFAHHGVLSKSRKPLAHHGPRFIKWYLSAVEGEWGKKAATSLKAIFVKHGVIAEGD